MSARLKVSLLLAGVFLLSLATVVPAGAAPLAASPGDVIITEIMYDADSAEPAWEWIEIYNASGGPVDLTDWVVDDDNSNAHSAANIASGGLAAGEQAILYNADAVSAADFSAAWGTVNLIPVTGWSSSAMGLNNGDDAVALWDSFSSYSGDNQAHANAIDNVDYGASGFPDPVGASIYLTDLGADNDVDLNWATSTDGGATPLFTGYLSANAGGNVGGEVGSPGTPPVVVDVPPTVTSTSPTDLATDVAVDANVTINFSEDVAASAGWYEISCVSSGIHAAAESGSPAAIYTLDPDSDFANSEHCTVTVVADFVEDVDGTPDKMVDDEVFSFDTVGEGGAPDLIITEIMYDPDSAEPAWEWIEIYNAGTASADLTGYVLDDNNSVAHGAANIAGGVVGPGEQAILYNGDAVSAGDFGLAWGTVNLIPVSNWTNSVMALNNGGDKVSLWDSFAAYNGDHQNHANAIETVDYAAAGFPDPVGASIYLTDLGADNNDGTNWATSTDGGATPLFTGYLSANAGGNVGGEVGSPGTPVAAPTDQLLLSEIVVTPTGGEFVEIYNPGGAPYDLSDVYLTDATFAGGGTYYYNLVTGTNAGGGSFDDFFARFPDGASIGAGEYQTIALNGSANFITEYGPSPTYELYEDDDSPDAIPDMREVVSGSIADQGGLSNGGEVVILFAWDGVSDLVTDLDYVVWGDKAEAVDKTGVVIDGLDADSDTSAYQPDTAIGSQDVVSTGSHSGDQSWQRDDLTEGAEVKTGGNGAGGHDETSEDWSNTWCTDDPTPNAASECPEPGDVEFGVCLDGLQTAIHDVQGNGLASPLVATNVVVEAVVTAQYQFANGIGGYFLQEEPLDEDADADTSEGLFVFDNANAVTVGQIVRVRGNVAEFGDLTEINGVGDYADCGAGPAISPTVINLPVAAIDDLEAYEGMLVNFPQDLTVTENFDLGQFGEVSLSVGGRLSTPTNVVEPGAPAIALQDLNDRSRILLNDGRGGSNLEPTFYPAGGLSGTNTLRSGWTVNGVTGILEYAFDSYRIEPIPSAPISFVDTNARTASPDAVGGSLRVASFNVLNYFTTIDDGSLICGPLADQGCRGADSASEFATQRAKIVSAIVALDADVVGLMEIENHAGDVPVADLVSGLNDLAGAGTYDYVATGAVGSDAIRVAFIYKPASVTPNGAYAVLDEGVDPLFLDDFNRPALAQTFDQNGADARFTVVVNHLKSKGSACDSIGDPDTGDGQGNCNLTRRDAAIALANWLATDPTGSGDPDVLIIGDLNSYALEDPIDALKAAGFTNLIETYVGPLAYSYVFFGQSGYLDHALSNAALTPQVTGVTEWHNNADEPSALDYNDFNTIFGLDPYRASDHDPVLVGLNLTPSLCNGLPATILGSNGSEVLFGTSGPDVIQALGGNDFISSSSGDDVICAGDGNDLVFSGDDSDWVDGGPGNDALDGQSGSDEMYGGDGHDYLLGASGGDVMHGGSGNDLLVGLSGSDQMTGGSGNDLLLGVSGPDHLDGNDGFDVLAGGSNNDVCLNGEINLSCETTGP